MMPGFFKDMPPAKGGKWKAIVRTTSFFRSPREVRCSIVTGLRRAYIKARFQALWVDWHTPDCDGEIGVEWEVRKAEQS